MCYVPLFRGGLLGTDAVLCSLASVVWRESGHAEPHRKEEVRNQRAWAAGTDLYTCSTFGVAFPLRLGELRQIASRTCVCVSLVVPCTGAGVSICSYAHGWGWLLMLMCEAGSCEGG